MASNKSPVIKGAVVAKALAGESNTQIANDLGISRPTVYRILNEAEFADLMAQGKSGIFSLIPKSVKALEMALDKGDCSEAKNILRNVGLMQSEQQGAPSTTVNFGVFGG